MSRAPEGVWPASLVQRQQVINSAVRHLRSRGKKFKSGVVSAALAASIWSKSEGEFIGIVERVIDQHEIPAGIEMPWGMVVKP